MTLKRKLLFLTTALMLSSTIHAQSAALAPVSPGVPTWPHPWYGARVAYLGDSLTDPRNSGSKKKLGIPGKLSPHHTICIWHQRTSVE